MGVGPEEGAEGFEDVGFGIWEERFDEIWPWIGHLHPHTLILLISLLSAHTSVDSIRFVRATRLIRKRGGRVDDEFWNSERSGHDHVRINPRSTAEDIYDEDERNEMFQYLSPVFARGHGTVWKTR